MIKKKDKINLFIISTIIMIIVVFLLLKNSYVINYELPEYFRNLFKETKELFPNFLFNLNGGTSALELTSYGIYNPIILVSYLFSSFNMKLYLIIVNIICSVGSTFLFYYLLRKNKFDEKISLIGTLTFLVMLPVFNCINILFIILSFIGADRYFEKNKSLFLIISIILLFIFNIGNSVISAVCILLYFLYKYFINKNKNRYSLLVILLPIMLCLFLIIPSSNIDINFLLSSSMYKLFSLIIFSLIVMFEDKSLVNKIFAVILAILLLFDFNARELLVPIYSYMICISLQKIYKGIDIKKIFAYIIFITIILIINESIKSYIYYIDTLILLMIFNTIINKKNNHIYLLLVIYLFLYSFINFEYKNYLKNNYEIINLEAYTSSKTYNLKSFNTYIYPYTKGILSEYVVTSDSKNTNYENHIVSSYIKTTDINYISPSIIRTNYDFNVLKNNSKMIINVPNMMKDKIIFVSFDLDGKTISINGIKNKNNEYKIYQKGLTKVEIIFDKGKYSISKFKIYYLDPKYIEKYDTKYINLHEKLDIEKDSYLATNIKYNENIIVKIDNKKIKTEKVNESNLGFRIKTGEHNIKIYYKNNMKYYMIISLSSILGFVYLVIIKK